MDTKTAEPILAHVTVIILKDNATTNMVDLYYFYTQICLNMEVHKWHLGQDS